MRRLQLFFVQMVIQLDTGLIALSIPSPVREQPLEVTELGLTAEQEVAKPLHRPVLKGALVLPLVPRISALAMEFSFRPGPLVDCTVFAVHLAVAAGLSVGINLAGEEAAVLVFDDLELRSYVASHFDILMDILILSENFTHHSSLSTSLFYRRRPDQNLFFKVLLKGEEKVIDLRVPDEGRNLPGLLPVQPLVLQKNAIFSESELPALHVPLVHRYQQPAASSGFLNIGLPVQLPAVEVAVNHGVVLVFDLPAAVVEIADEEALIELVAAFVPEIEFPSYLYLAGDAELVLVVLDTDFFSTTTPDSM